MDKYKIGFWIAVGIIIILFIVNSALSTTISTIQAPKECKPVACEGADYRLVYHDMCEMRNTQVDLVNKAADYIDNYCNPFNVVLSRQQKLNCDALVTAIND